MQTQKKFGIHSLNAWVKILRKELFTMGTLKGKDIRNYTDEEIQYFVKIAQELKRLAPETYESTLRKIAQFAE